MVIPMDVEKRTSSTASTGYELHLFNVISVGTILVVVVNEFLYNNNWRQRITYICNIDEIFERFFIFSHRVTDQNCASFTLMFAKMK